MDRDIDHVAPQGEAVPHLRFLKLMVGGLAIAMVLGLAAITAILWIRLNAPALPALPDLVRLPEGSHAAAVTFAPDRLIVVTDRDEVLVYDRDGALLQQIALDQP